MPQVLTANDLPTGDVIYWTGTGWTADVRHALIITDAAAAEEVGKKEVAARRVIEPYLIEVALKDGAPWPVRYREIVRATGPSVRLDLGKQANLAPSA